MRANQRSIRFSVMLLTGIILVGQTSSATFAQAGRRGAGGMRIRGANQAQNQAQQKFQRLGGSSGIKNRVQNKAQNQVQAKAKDIFRSQGKDIVKQKAQQNGYTMAQVLNHRNQVKNKLQSNIQDRAKAKARDWVTNNGRDFAKAKLKQYGVNQVKQQVANHPSNERHDRIQYLRRHSNHHFHWSWQKWCHFYPVRCHWWYAYCGPVYYFDPTCTTTCNWYDYYLCPVEIQTVVSAPEVRWNLGLKCILIPDKGLGIEAVKPESPADVAGLQPGMIITSAGGIAIVDETSMPRAIDRSGGVLDLEVLTSADAEPAQVTVQMEQMLVTDY